MGKAIIYPKFRWFMLVTVTIGYLTVGTLLIAPATVVGIIAKDFGITAGQVSAAMMGVYTLSAAIATIASGPLIDRFGIAPSIIAGSFLAVVAPLLTLAVGDTIGGAVFTRILTGLSAGPMSACVSAVAARWFPPEERGIFAGVQGSGMAIGIGIGLAAMPAALKLTGRWQSGIALLAILPVITLIMTGITGFVREPEFAEERNAAPESGKDFKIALRQLPFYVGLLCIFIFMWIQNSFNDLTPGYIAIPDTGLGFGPAAAGKFMGAVQIGMILGSIACGFIMQKLLKGRIKPVVLTGFLLAAVFMFSVKFKFVWGTPGLLAGCLFLAGFFEGFIVPMIVTFISMYYPKNIAGKVYGMSFGIGVFGGTIGVLLGSTFLHFSGHYNLSIIAVSIVGFIGFLVAMGLNRPKAFIGVK
jgi:MFS family permease